MITIFVAVILTCTTSPSDPNIRCDYGASDDVYYDLYSCQKYATKSYRRKVKCISVDVEMKETPFKPRLQ